MNFWLTNKDIEGLVSDDGRWHKVAIEYDPPLGLIKVDGEIVACFKGEVRN